MATFEELGLDETLLKAVGELGFTQPTPIQEKAIPVLLSGTKDLIGLAQTGTGKTAAFGLPLLQLVESAKKYPQALVICPTRELCMQIVNELELFKSIQQGCTLWQSTAVLPYPCRSAISVAVFRSLWLHPEDLLI